MSNKEIPVRDSAFRSGSGVSTFLSFVRLEEALQITGELKPNEQISGVVITDYGIQYYIQKQEE